MHKQRSKVFRLTIAAQINSLPKNNQERTKRTQIIYIITGQVSPRNNTSHKRRQVEESTGIRGRQTKSLMKFNWTSNTFFIYISKRIIIKSATQVLRKYTRKMPN